MGAVSRAWSTKKGLDLGRDPDELSSIARAARAAIVRAVAKAKAGHIGGPLSAVDVLTALYFGVMRINPADPAWAERDRFVLSKGHSAIALYAVLALRGYFPVNELDSFDAIDSRLQGHPDMTRLPGIDMSTGSLGLGLTAAVGMALGARLDADDFRVYAMVGDGECQEGAIWEAADIAARYSLGNLRCIVDFNGLQQYGWATSDGGRTPPFTAEGLAARWRAFGWNVVFADGHDFGSIFDALDALTEEETAPGVFIARTVKGKGVPFMETDYSWHARVPTEDELAAALSALGGD